MRGIIENIIENIKKKKISEYEVFLVRRRSNLIEIKDRELEFLKSSEGVGISLRIINNGRLGFSYSMSIESTAINIMIDRAIEVSKNSDRDIYLCIPCKLSYPPLDIEIYDDKILTISNHEKKEKGLILEDEALSYDNRVKKVRKGTIEDVYRDIFIKNSNDIDINYKTSNFSCSIMVIAEDGNDSEIGYDYQSSCFYDELDVKDIGRSASRKAVEMLGGRKIKTSKLPVILDNYVASEFLGIISSSIFADNIQKGKSILKDKIDTEVFSNLINIYDDGIYPKAVGSSPYDDEGVVKRRKKIVSSGVLKDFLYDNYTAKKDNRESTGNSIRNDIKSPPNIGISNLYIENGLYDRNEIIKDINKGILVTDIMGVHTADTISGDFSFGASGLFIENGNISFPVKGIAISGNIFRLFKSVVNIANDIRFFGRIGSPSLLISEISISGE
jgi:PmbA protein